MLIVDANSVASRAFHSRKDDRFNPFEFVNAVQSVGEKEVVFCFDSPSFRKGLYPEYKANRTPDPVRQEYINWLETALTGNATVIKQNGYEADDLVASVFDRFGGIPMSGDQDLFQLGKLFYNGKLLDEWGIKSKLGVESAQVVDFKALMGDPADNISGINGIGKTYAKGLLNTYGNLDGIYYAIEIDQFDFPRLTDKLLAGKQQAYFWRGLVTLRKDANVDIVPQKVNWGHVVKFLKDIYA